MSWYSSLGMAMTKGKVTLSIFLIKGVLPEAVSLGVTVTNKTNASTPGIESQALRWREPHAASGQKMMTQPVNPYIKHLNQLEETIRNVTEGMAGQVNNWLRNNKKCCPCVVVTIVRGDTTLATSTPTKFASVRICKPVGRIVYDWNKNTLNAR